MSSSLAHVLVDYHLGLYGEASSSMSLLQAANIVMTCLVTAWWIICVVSAAATGGPGLSGAIVLAIGWGFLANGLGAVIAAPPPSDAFPYQDVAHLFNIIFGALAAIATLRELKRSETPWSWRWGAVAIVLLSGLFVVQAVLSSPIV